MVCTQLERSCWRRVGEVEKKVPNPKLGLPAALIEEDKPQLPLEEDSSDKPSIHLPKAEPRAGRRPVALRLIQTIKRSETASAAGPGLPPGDRDKTENVLNLTKLLTHTLYSVNYNCNVCDSWVYEVVFITANSSQ